MRWYIISLPQKSSNQLCNKAPSAFFVDTVNNGFKISCQAFVFYCIGALLNKGK
jgi:hypothetical protein